MEDKLQVLGLAGSLRLGSYNRGLLRAAIQLQPEDMKIDTFELNWLPLFNDDIRLEGFPAAVENLRSEIRAADALLIATPEYLNSISGVLKNAFDWASRPPGQPFDSKPVAMMGATTRKWGTINAQRHLRQIFAYLNMFPLNQPEVLITDAKDKFDEEGNLLDETARINIAELLTALGHWIRHLQIQQ